MCKKTSSKTFFLKRDVCQHFAALRTGKRHPFYLSLIQIIMFLVQKVRLPVFCIIFSQKLANVPPGQNVGKRTPKKSGGLLGDLYFLLVLGFCWFFVSSDYSHIVIFIWALIFCRRGSRHFPQPPCRMAPRRRLLAINI